MFNRRGTLAVARLATAMLMLDIAVVNTALPRVVVGVTAFGALVPTRNAAGRSNAAEFVAGFHRALITGSAIAPAGALLSAWPIGLAPRKPATHPAVSQFEPA